VEPFIAEVSELTAVVSMEALSNSSAGPDGNRPAQSETAPALRDEASADEGLPQEAALVDFAAADAVPIVTV
jgi:hypothetical protein